MSRNIHEAMYNDLIEITWTFDRLADEGRIKPWNDLIEATPTGSDGIKETFVRIAEEFEKKYPLETTWDDGDLDYLIEIQKFAEEWLLKEFGNEKEELHVDDVVKMLTVVGASMHNIGIIRDIDWSKDGEPKYGVKPLFADYIYYFSRDQLETGNLEWVKDE